MTAPSGPYNAETPPAPTTIAGWTQRALNGPLSAEPNTMIGGGSVVTENGWSVADCPTLEVAQHLADLHNMWLRQRRP